MARLIQKTFGKVRGKVGDVVFKELFGETIIVSKPKSYKKSMDAVSVGNRKKFSFFAAFSSAIGKIYWFKQIWKASSIPGNIFTNKIFTINHRLIGTDFDISNSQMIPIVDGFEAHLVSSSLNESSLSVTIAPLLKDSGISTNKKVSAQGVVYLRGPIDADDKPFAFIPVYSDDVVAKEGEELTFEMTWSGYDKIRYSDYFEHSFLIILLTKNIQGEPQNASVNIFG